MFKIFRKKNAYMTFTFESFFMYNPIFIPHLKDTNNSRK